MTKKLLGLTLMATGLVAGFSSAINFSFTSFAPQDPIADKFADTHFFAPGNDYAGSFFWLPTQQILPSATVTLGATSRTCTKQVRGLYYSNAWGARLWPLDLQTYSGLLAIDPSYADLSMNGSFYTSCTNSLSTNSLELYSVYGQMSYTWKGKTFSLSMGRRYDVVSNTTLSGGPLVSSVQYFNNQTPLGYFYDNIAGIGFIGGILPTVAHTGIVNQLNNGGYINDIFRFQTGSTTILTAVTSGGTYTLSGAMDAGLDTLWRIAILGNVLLSKGGLDIDDRRSVLGNPNQTSIVVSDKMNISSSINLLKRSASELCRGKKAYNYTNYTSAPAGIVCIGSAADSFTELDPITINLSNTTEYDGKTFVVYGKNVVLANTMPQSNSYALNIFVDKGNVILNEGAPTVMFDKDGNLGGTIAATFLRGNIFINGLLLPNSGTPLTHKVYVHGKFASLNTGLEPTTTRKTQIATLLDSNFSTFGSSISTNYCASTNCINFNNIFAWQCQLSGIGTDGNLCNVAGDRFKYNPFIIIDRSISTSLIQQ